MKKFIVFRLLRIMVIDNLTHTIFVPNCMHNVRELSGGSSRAFQQPVTSIIVTHANTETQTQDEYDRALKRGRAGGIVCHIPKCKWFIYGYVFLTVFVYVFFSRYALLCRLAKRSAYGRYTKCRYTNRQTESSFRIH